MTTTAQTWSDTRQHFTVLSDVLGVSMLADEINYRRPNDATKNTIFGPFHVDGSPERAMGNTNSLDRKGELCLFHGPMLDLNGTPVEGTVVDVWSDNEDGFCDAHQPEMQPQRNNRGDFRTGADERYWFRSVKPISCPILDHEPAAKGLRRSSSIQGNRCKCTFCEC
ncbi:MAG: dioxygenase [Pseudomonadota bacterium]